MTIYTDDDFTRSNTTAGTVTGPTIGGTATYASPSTGAAYTDVLGSTWSIGGDRLVASGLSGGSYSQAFLVRPVSEAQVDSQVTVSGTSGTSGAAISAVVRYNPSAGAQGAAYAAYYYGTTFALSYFGPGGNTQTILASTTVTGLSAGDNTIVLTATGTNPTTLTATITAGGYGSGNPVLQTLTATDSSANLLQQAGQMGLTANNTPSISRLQTATPGSGGGGGGGSGALSIGTLSVSQAAGGNQVTISAAPSGGTGSGLSWAVYRGTDPNFTQGSGSVVVSGLTGTSWVDTTGTPGTIYYYGALAADSGSDSAQSLPAGLGSTGSVTTPMYLPGQMPQPGAAVVFVGDSITYGANLANAGSSTTGTVPANAIAQLGALQPGRKFVGLNCGVSGTCLSTDWAPDGSLWVSDLKNNGTSQAAVLFAAYPGASQVFSIMLGTNDSSYGGSGGTPQTATGYGAALTTLVTRLLAEWPTCKVVIHYPTWHSPNAHNGAEYLQPTLSTLVSYFPQIRSVVSAFRASNPVRVFLGDTVNFSAMAANYQGLLQNEAGASGYGTFYLHPNASGVVVVGQNHGTALATALYGSANARAYA